MNNDQDTAFQYGLNREIFSKNKAKIIWDDICYDVILVDKECCEKSIAQRIFVEKVYDKEVPEKTQGVGAGQTEGGNEDFVVQNPYGLKIRTDRLAAGILQTTRSKVKKLIKDGILEI